MNSTFFATLLIPFFVKNLSKFGATWRTTFRRQKGSGKYALLADGERDEPQKVTGDGGSAVNDNHGPHENSFGDNTRPIEDVDISSTEDKLNTREIAWLSFEFSILWVGTEGGFFKSSGS